MDKVRFHEYFKAELLNTYRVIFYKFPDYQNYVNLEKRNYIESPTFEHKMCQIFGENWKQITIKQFKKEQSERKKYEYTPSNQYDAHHGPGYFIPSKYGGGGSERTYLQYDTPNLTLLDFYGRYAVDFSPSMTNREYRKAIVEKVLNEVRFPILRELVRSLEFEKFDRSLALKLETYYDSTYIEYRKNGTKLFGELAFILNQFCIEQKRDLCAVRKDYVMNWCYLFCTIMSSKKTTRFFVDIQTHPMHYGILGKQVGDTFDLPGIDLCYRIDQII